jgi:gluconokinase
MIVVLTGVAGSGKTTVGQTLAASLGWSFRDADEFHPPENIAKMSAGIPLTDGERTPWLAAIRAHIDACLARGEHAVLTCSALKERYREILTAGAPQVKLVQLAGSPELIQQRISAREGHFMKPEMLRSQFEALEMPRDAITVDIAAAPEQIVAEIRRKLNL